MPYLVATVAAAVLIFAGLTCASDRLASCFMNLGCNFLAAVVVLLVVERTFRPVNLRHVGHATLSAVTPVAALFSPKIRDTPTYAR
jgi:hypothetical protein